jgi:GT2 family glycosyltransferase
VFDKMGWFDESLRYCDDWDWFMRAREKGITMITHPEVVLLYRRHDQNMTNETDLGNLHFTRMLKQSLDRRRRQNRGDAKSLPNLSDVNFEGDADGKAEDLTDD